MLRDVWNVDTFKGGRSMPLRVCASDPGVSTFQTFYDINDHSVLEMGPNDIGKIFKLCKRADEQQSKITKCSVATAKIAYKRVYCRLLQKIRNLVDEVHRQLAQSLSKH